MQLGQQLANLKLEHKFVKELNQDDIDFAQKEYHKLYAEQMSKLSFKLQKIQRVKRNLHDIEQQENSKLKGMKQSLSKKYEFIEKNKQKYMTQKLKSYKIHHELWEDKITSIKRKNRQNMRAHADKSQKYADQVENFWKTKTQQIFASSHDHLESEKNKLTMLNKNSQRLPVKMPTEGSERKSSILIKKDEKLSRYNTSNHENSQLKNHTRRETKQIRFTTENRKQSNLNQERNKNQSSVSKKQSIHSHKDLKVHNNTGSRKFIKMPYLDQNRFSHQLISENKMNSTHNNLGSRPNLHGQNLPSYKLTIRNELLAEQSNFSFQKAMKKLDKIQKIKEKHLKKLQPSQNSLSPCRPRKAIDAAQYRLLRAKSQVKKSKQKIDTEQNMENTSTKTKDRFLGSKTIRNRTLGSEQRYHNAYKTAQSRMSIAQSRMKQEEQRAKERSRVLEIDTKRWKKQRIVKAIKDRIFKIKLGQMQKIKEKQNI